MSEPPTGPVVVVIEIPETIGDGDTRRAMIERVRELASMGRATILLDVSALKSADTEQLGAIIQAYITATKNGGTLRLMHATPRLRRLLAITKVDHIIDTGA